MSFLDSKTHHAGVLAGIYLVNAVVAPLTLFYAVSALPFKTSGWPCAVVND